MGRRFAKLGVLALVAQAAACEVVLGISGHDSHAVDPTAADASVDAPTVDPDADAEAPHCAFATSGDARLRVGVLAPTFDRVDVCVAKAGGAFDGAPIVASATGNACPDGLGYKDVTAPIALASGAYDLKVVARGRACDAPAIASASNVALAPQRTVAAYLLGDGAAPPVIKSFPESRAGASRVRIRFVHALASMPSPSAPASVAPPLDFELLDARSQPPQTISTYALRVPFGATGSPDPDAGNPIDENGYVEIAAPELRATFGARADSGDLLAVKSGVLHGSDTYTAFAIGRGHDPSFVRELYLCDEGRSDGVLARCGLAAPVDLTIATHNAYQWGVFAPMAAQRKPAELDAIAALDADVVCMSEVWSDADKRALIEKVKSKLPYSLMYVDTLATKPSDPTDQNGAVPPPPSSPACSGSEAKLNAALDCVAKSCATKPGDDSSAVSGDDPVGCITSNCLTEGQALFAGNAQERACWSCAYTSINDGSPIKAARTACTTDPAARYSFRGANSVVVLSRYPIDTTKSEEWVLPSTEWRATFVRAAIEASAGTSGATVDVYCGELTSPQDPVFHPYTGQYGGGATGAGAWRAEQLLQAKKLAAFVASRSIGQSAIVTGELYAGPSIAGVVSAVNAPAYAALARAFGIAEAPDFPGACTFCNDNPITTPPGSTPNLDSSWTSLVMTYGIPRTDVLRSSVVVKDATVPTSAGYAIPPSPYYAYRTVVRLRF